MAGDRREQVQEREHEHEHEHGEHREEDHGSALQNSTLQVTIQHHGKPITFAFANDDNDNGDDDDDVIGATMQDLSDRVSAELAIPAENQKFLIAPRTGIVRPPFAAPSSDAAVAAADATTDAVTDTRHARQKPNEKNEKKENTNYALASLLAQGKRITLMGSTPAEINSLASTAQSLRQKRLDRATLPYLRPAKPSPTTSRSNGTINTINSNSSTYAFQTIRPLPHLPDPARSSAYLHRLASDPGIRAAMHRHRFTVALLTEMDPAQHTTHASRTLGLNRNKGEVIELRLRTDAGDGYRDYRTVRRTLCHELAHNVFGEHDGRFWELCGRIEREVERDDWRGAGGGGGGRSVGGQVYYEPMGGSGEGGGEMVDEGGWVGGEYVLGGGEDVAVSSGSAGANTDAQSLNAGLSRRQILAQAAEARMKMKKQSGQAPQQQQQ